MRRSLFPFLTSLSVMVALALTATVSGGLAGAQDSATPSITEDDVPRPAHIHFDTCETLGDVAFPLNDVTDVTIAGSPVASPIVETPQDPNIEMGERVLESITEVEATLDTLLGENASYAINVHDSAEKIDLYIACGDIVGEPENDRLEIELNEQNDSGFEGGAVLEQTGENTVTVTVTLYDVSDVNATPGT